MRSGAESICWFFCRCYSPENIEAAGAAEIKYNVSLYTHLTVDLALESLNVMIFHIASNALQIAKVE